MITNKKLYILPFVLILAISVLTACSKDDSVLKGNFAEIQDGAYEGILEKLPTIDVYQQGTHMLTLDNEEIILLQSRSIDLNRYLDEEVRVNGEVSVGIGDTQDVLTVSTVEYLDEGKLQEWSEYKNNLYGFSFEHPETWQLSEDSGEVALSFEEEDLLRIKIASDETDLDVYVSYEEEGEGTEVTIGAQRAIRFASGTQMRFYVPNPPKKKIYMIQYIPTINKVDDEKGAKKELNMFYDLLESFELIYMTQLTGDTCGGLQQIECDEGYRCELESGGKYAEGVCVPTDSDTSSSSCPFIAAPANCFDYRISEYSKNGCPSRYECIGEGDKMTLPTFRDLNVVDAGKRPEEYDEEDAVEEEGEESASPDSEVMDLPEVEDEVVVEAEVAEVAELKEETAEYDAPESDEVSREYVNNRRNFSVLYPKNWYYASFGAIDGTLWKVGFSSEPLEEASEAIISLSIMDKDGGRVSKKIGDEYFVLDGPADLIEVMQSMADSAESF